MTAPRRVAVIGGGVCGLLAGLRLRQLGVDVTVYEASAHAGGMLQTVRRDGWLAERGPPTLGEPHPDVRGLLEGIGVMDKLIRPSVAMKRRYLLHGGVPVAVPSRVAELVSSPLLSMTGRLRLLKEPFIARDDSDDEESVDHFVRRRLGEEVAERIIDPYLAGTNGGDPRRLLARYILPKLVEYERSAGSILKGSLRARRNVRRRGGGGTWSCRGGMSELVERLVAGLPGALRVNTPVHALARGPDGISVHTDEGLPTEFAGVVLAVSAPALGRLGATLREEGQFAQIAAMPQGSLAVVSVGFRREDVGHPLDGFGLLIATAEKRRILGVLFPSSLFEDRAPAGHVLLTVTVGGARQKDLVDQPDEALIRMVLDELRDILQVRGTPVFLDLCRWRDVIPQMEAGHAARLAAADAVEQQASGMVLTGAWRDGLTVGEAMFGGVRAADRLQQQMLSASSVPLP